jgi:hypothetical protein
MFCVMFEWIKINKMYISSQQMRWLDGERVDFHPWGSKIFHKWHGLWSMVEYWTNISYLHNQHMLGAY